MTGLIFRVKFKETTMQNLVAAARAKRVYYFAGNRSVARSVPTIVFLVNPPASTALR
jgi:hypothetical protein